MSVAGVTKQYNSFINGIVTDANEFNAPENAAREMLNIDIGDLGEALKRDGAELLGSSTGLGTGTSSWKIHCDTWDGAGSENSLSVIVAQVGHFLVVYDIFTSGYPTSTASPLNLATELGVSAALIQDTTWHFESGDDGVLYVFTGTTDVARVHFDETTGPYIFSAVVTMRVRDTWGISDGVDLGEEPVTLSADHEYNLLNQGWDATKIAAYFAAIATYPSNSQQWFQGRDATGVFSPTELDKLDFGTATAPRGRHIFDAYNIDRSSIVTGAEDWGFNSTYGPQFGVVYADRIFYLGLEKAGSSQSFPGLSSGILYSQLLDGRSATSVNDINKYESCYSEGDVTSEFQNSILATDGGYLSLPKLGVIRGGVVLGVSLILFTTSGIWALNGGSGSIFTADQINLDQISEEVVLNRQSIVKAGTEVLCWSEEGLISLREGENSGVFSVTNLTDLRYSEGYRELKSLAQSTLDVSLKGSFQKRRGIAEWSVTEGSSDSTRRLRFNTKTRAFTLYSGPVYHTGGVELPSGEDDVYYLKPSFDGGNVGVQWYTYTNSLKLDIGSLDYPTYIITWSEHVGAPHLRKQALRLHTFFKRTEENWTAADTFDNQSGAQATVYWDWADHDVAASKKTGPFDIYRMLRLPDDPGSGYPVALDYSPTLIVNKPKVRGSGNSLQFKFEGKTGKDFRMLGWSVPIQVSTTP